MRGWFQGRGITTAGTGHNNGGRVSRAGVQGLASLAGCRPLLFAHIKQQPVVDVVDAEHGHHHRRVDNQIFITFDIFKQEDKRQNGDNHHQKIKDGNTIK